MTTIHLSGYRADDLPACLAAAGLVRVLTIHRATPARISWDGMHPILHLPDAVTPSIVADHLRSIATERADSPDWYALDACDHGEQWESMRTAIRDEIRAGISGHTLFISAAGAYHDGQGGRSPLNCTARMMTLGKWARQAVAASAKTDWLAHFAAWSEADKSWQGWRPALDARSSHSGDADYAAVWLAIEGLTYYPCSIAPWHERLTREQEKWLENPKHWDESGEPMEMPKSLRSEIIRRHIQCPGWCYDEGVFSYPLPTQPTDMATLQRLVRSGRTLSHARFTRRQKRVGPVVVSDYGAAEIHDLF